MTDKAPDLSLVERFIGYPSDDPDRPRIVRFLPHENGHWVRASDYDTLVLQLDALTKEMTSYHDAYEGEKQGRAIEVDALTKERDEAMGLLQRIEDDVRSVRLWDLRQVIEQDENYRGIENPLSPIVLRLATVVEKLILDLEGRHN